MPRLRMARDTSPCLHKQHPAWEGSAHFQQPLYRAARLEHITSWLLAAHAHQPMRSPGVQCKEEAEAGVRRHDARAGTAAAAALVQQQHACIGKMRVGASMILAR